MNSESTAMKPGCVSRVTWHSFIHGLLDEDQSDALGRHLDECPEGE